MKKVCFITSNLLPVPNVKGGAIETIMTNIITEQEKKGKLDMTIVSIYDKNALMESCKYKKTKFIYIKKNISYIIHSIYYKIANKILKKNYYNTYNHFVLKKIKKLDFDYIIAEGGHYESYKEFLKYFNKEQLVLHLHHKGESNEIIDNNFSKLIGVSNFVIEDFKKNSNIKNYYLLKNSIPIKNFEKELKSKEKIKIKGELGLTNDDFVIIYCGRLIKEKGVLELVKAVKKIDNPNIKLLVVGSINFANGGHDSYTQALSEETKDTNKIIMTGYIDNSELYKYYKLADIMIIPSLGEEAAGLVCIEGMICRKPIITTDAGGIGEYVTPQTIVINRNKNFINNLKKEILELHKNQDDFSKIGEENYRYALKFNNENYYNNLLEIIEKNLEKK